MPARWATSLRQRRSFQSPRTRSEGSLERAGQAAHSARRPPSTPRCRRQRSLSDPEPYLASHFDLQRDTELRRVPAPAVVPRESRPADVLLLELLVQRIGQVANLEAHGDLRGDLVKERSIQ